MPEQARIQRAGFDHRLRNPESADLAAVSSKRMSGSSALSEYRRILWKRRLSFLLSAAVIFCFTMAVTFVEKPVYEATALVEIEPPRPDVVNVGQLFDHEAVNDNYLQTQFEILQSGTLARRVISDLGLDHLPSVSGDDGSQWRAGRSRVSAEKQSQSVLRDFQARLTVLPVPRTRLARISFEDRDPALAARVANSITKEYLSQNLRSRWDAAEKASDWLKTEIETARKNLQTSQARLQSYASGNGLLYFENQQGSTDNIVDAKLRQLQSELTRAQADRYEKESLYTLVREGDNRAAAQFSKDPIVQDLATQLAGLQRQRAQLAADFKPGYPRMQALQNEITRVQQSLAEERSADVNRIENDFRASEQHEILLSDAFRREQEQANATAGKSAQYKILKHDVDANQSLYEGLLDRQKDAGISAEMNAANIRVIDPAVPPAFSIRPRVLFNLSFGFLLALAGGFAFAFLRERNDKSLGSAAEASEILHLPILAELPAMKCSPGRRITRLAKLSSFVKWTWHSPKRGLRNGADRRESAVPNPEFLKALQALQTSILLSSAEHPPRSLAILSAATSEGKTTVCCELAAALAKSGKRVLVIDANLRGPALREYFNLAPVEGVAACLAGGHPWRAAVQPSPISGLDCLICKAGAPDPKELLLSSRMTLLLREAEREYDFVLVDTPAPINGSEAGILAASVERAILVVKKSSSGRDLAQEAQTQALENGANFLGFVFLNFEDCAPSGAPARKHEMEIADVTSSVRRATVLHSEAHERNEVAL